MGNALQFALVALQVAALGAEQLEWARTRVQHFADTGTDPTAADWDELNARTHAVRDRLNAEPAA